jgi:predicted nucleic acid-binding protein
MRPNLRDEADNIFVELAFGSGSEYLITKNIRDFTVDTDLNLGQLTIVTPAEFMKEWRARHGDKA